jgi:cobalt/nickel transport protein
MRAALCPPLALITLVLASSAVQAHYQMLLPETPSAKRGPPVTVFYQWGHPFEHQLFEAPAPRAVFVIGPGGGKMDLTKKLEAFSVRGAEGKQVTAYRFRFTPKFRCDYVVVLETPPIWMPEEKVFFQDTARVVVHVQDQDGWDAATGQDFELVPLTRPYGLQPGMVFQARALLYEGRKSAAGLLVEVEHYNPVPPKVLPSDEQITRTAKTDPNGVVTCSLPEAGWWAVTALRPGGQLRRQGQDYPVRQRTTFWVYVEERAKSAGR